MGVPPVIIHIRLRFSRTPTIQLSLGPGRLPPRFGDPGRHQTGRRCRRRLGTITGGTPIAGLSIRENPNKNMMDDNYRGTPINIGNPILINEETLGFKFDCNCTLQLHMGTGKSGGLRMMFEIRVAPFRAPMLLLFFEWET